MYSLVTVIIIIKITTSTVDRICNSDVSECTFNCKKYDTDDTCDGHTSTQPLKCNSGSICTANCNGYLSCQATHIDGTNAQQLTVTSDYRNALSKTIITCPTVPNGECIINCGKYTDCQRITINAQNTNKLIINIPADGDIDALKDNMNINEPINGILEINCPNNDNLCIPSGLLTGTSTGYFEQTADCIVSFEDFINIWGSSKFFSEDVDKGIHSCDNEQIDICNDERNCYLYPDALDNGNYNECLEKKFDDKSMPTHICKYFRRIFVFFLTF